MTDTNNKTTEQTDNIDLEQTQNSETQTETTEQITADEVIKQQQEKINQLEQALQVAKKNESEAMLRARAEIDNVRRRVEQDVEKAHKFALEKFSTELLSVIDNLERALTTLDRESEDHKAIIEGIELTLKSLLDTMKKFGVDAVNTEGEQLNPDYHQAITMIESPDHSAGQIVNTIQKGYTLNGRLIRPAMVVVAK